jgi:hypothetical protein
MSTEIFLTMDIVAPNKTVFLVEGKDQMKIKHF